MEKKQPAALEIASKLDIAKAAYEDVRSVEADLSVPDPEQPAAVEAAFADAKLAEVCRSCGRQKPDVKNGLCKACRERAGVDIVIQN